MRPYETARAAAIAARNVILGGNLVSLALLSQPRKLLECANQALFFYKAFANKRGLPQRNVFEVLRPSKVECVQLGCLYSPDGRGQPWFHAIASYSTDLISLCLLCQILKPKVVFEIGTLHGYTAYHMALNSPEDAQIYTLDLPPDRMAPPKLKTTLIDDNHISIADRAYCFDDSTAVKKILPLYGDSATFDFSPFWGKVDLFFIDGAHSYEYVAEDSMNAIKCCHSGSVIVWHDFGRAGVNGVSKWLVRLARNYAIYAVPGGSLAFTVLQ